MSHLFDRALGDMKDLTMDEVLVALAVQFCAEQGNEPTLERLVWMTRADRPRVEAALDGLKRRGS